MAYTEPNLPADIRGLLSELNFIWIPGTIFEFIGDQQYSARLLYHRDKWDCLDVRLGTKAGYGYHEDIKLNNAYEDIKMLLRKLGYPVDQTIRLKRLHALID